MTDENRTIFRIPPPVVLVIGEFGTEPDCDPSRRAWEAIAGDIAKKCAHADLRTAVEGIADGSANIGPAIDLLREHAGSGTCLSPYPLRIDITKYVGPGDQREALQQRLHTLLRRLNVIGVIACGTAHAATTTLDVLAPFDVPTVLTLSSAMHASGNGYAAPLQLMPNNSLQAHAILAACDGILSSGSSRDIHVLATPRDDPYVKSLWTELEDSTKWGYDFRMVRVAEATPARAIHNTRVLLCVGYEDAIATAESIASRFDAVILSDGCAAQNFKAKRIFRTRSAATPEQYAVDAWQAFRSTHRAMQIDAGLEPVGRLKPPIARIRSALTEQGYKFEGFTNVRHGFVVREEASGASENDE